METIIWILQHNDYSANIEYPIILSVFFCLALECICIIKVTKNCIHSY